jgi:uncharacterized membrane protein YidH (DUF202 family)
MSDGVSAFARDPGLQVERTSLSWTRTSLAIWANGVLLLVKDVVGRGHWTGFAGAATAAVIAVGVLVIGARRQRVLSRRLTADISPRREVFIAGGAVLFLILVVSLTLFL